MGSGVQGWKGEQRNGIWAITNADDRHSVWMGRWGLHTVYHEHHAHSRTAPRTELPLVVLHKNRRNVVVVGRHHSHCLEEVREMVGGRSHVREIRSSHVVGNGGDNHHHDEGCNHEEVHDDRRNRLVGLQDSHARHVAQESGSGSGRGDALLEATDVVSFGTRGNGGVVMTYISDTSDVLSLELAIVKFFDSATEICHGFVFDKAERGLV